MKPKKTPATKKSSAHAKSNGANGHVKLKTGDGTEVEADIANPLPLGEVKGTASLPDCEHGLSVDDPCLECDPEQHDSPARALDDSASVLELAIADRAEDLLFLADISSVGQLCENSRDELLAIEGATEAVVEHVEKALAAVGRHLAGVSPAAVAAPPPAPRSKLTRFFARKLTGEERGKISGEMMRAVLARQSLEEKISEAKKVIAGLKKEQDVHDARVLDLARQRHDGTVNDEIACFEKEGADPTGADARPGVITYRGDTFEALEWRPLSPNERQGTLFSEGEKFLPTSASAP